MKEIKLSQGQIAQVDDEDYEFLNQWGWHAFHDGRNSYARRVNNIKHVTYRYFMHRVLLSPPNNLQIDHIDHNGLNNQKYNLRFCTYAQNGMNKRCSGKSGYLGVFISSGYITSAIKVNGKQIYLGSYKTIEDAALAYNKAASKFHGEYANLNIIK